MQVLGPISGLDGLYTSGSSCADGSPVKSSVCLDILDT